MGVVLSFIRPIWVIYFMIVFSLYWLFRVVYFVIYICISWYRYRRDLTADWLAQVKDKPDWQRIYHLVFLPTYKEPLEVLRSTFQSLINSDYPLDKFIVVLAGEERDLENFKNNAEVIKKEFNDKFFKLLITYHPDNLPDEIKAKGANAHWAGQRAQELIDRLGIPYQDIIVSYFDIDTVVHPKYFSCLTYKYLTDPEPLRSSYQPVVLYNNNIWDAPSMMRITAFGTTFWLMTELPKPDRIFTFSSHSMSFQALVDVNFWQKDIVTDDSRIFLQCFVRYDGDYKIVPLYVPVSMDTVNADGYWRSFVNLYKQQRRWAWGIEHFPYMIWNFFFKKNKISLKKKVKCLWNFSEGMYSWATAPILLFVFGKLPLWLAGPQAQATVIVQSAPFVLQWVLSLAMIGIFVSATFSLMLLPPRPRQHAPHKFLIMILQWILLPISIVVFGAIPAIESQTRLMLGKYLGFWVTEKSRKSADQPLVSQPVIITAGSSRPDNKEHLISEI